VLFASHQPLVVQLGESALAMVVDVLAQLLPVLGLGDVVRVVPPAHVLG
jgi:hypothetical protein